MGQSCEEGSRLFHIGVEGSQQETTVTEGPEERWPHAGFMEQRLQPVRPCCKVGSANCFRGLL